MLLCCARQPQGISKSLDHHAALQGMPAFVPSRMSAMGHPALMQSLKHYKVLRERRHPTRVVVDHFVWTKFRFRRNSSHAANVLAGPSLTLNGSRACWRAIAMAQNSLSQNIYYGV
jgi:hypothetical protein